MKAKLFALLIVLVPIVATAPSCTWLKSVNTTVSKTDQTKLDEVNAIVEIGTRYATTYEIKQNAKTAPVFSAAAVAISALVQAETFDPTTVKSWISDAMTKQDPALTEVAMLSLDLALVKYKEFYDLNIKTYRDDAHVYASFLAAIGSGMRSAVAQSVNTTTVASAKPGPNPMASLTSSNLKL